MILWIEKGSRASLSVFKSCKKKRVAELKAELHIFISQKRNIIAADIFHDDKKLSVLCYLADIFEKTNTKLSLQGKIDILINKWESVCFSEETNVMERTFWKHV